MLAETEGKSTLSKFSKLCNVISSNGKVSKPNQILIKFKFPYN